MKIGKPRFKKKGYIHSFRSNEHYFDRCALKWQPIFMKNTMKKQKYKTYWGLNLKRGYNLCLHYIDSIMWICAYLLTHCHPKSKNSTPCLACISCVSNRPPSLSVRREIWYFELYKTQVCLTSSGQVYYKTRLFKDCLKDNKSLSALIYLF